MFGLKSMKSVKAAKMPYIYEIEPTNHCPYKCIMCPRGLGKMKRETGFMSIDVFEKLLTMVPPGQKMVRLHHFGEAVLHPEIDIMIKMVSRAGLVPVISLNPSTLNESLCQRIINASPGLVCFSLDAFTDKGLAKIRGIRQSYEECIAFIDMFVKKSRESSYKILKVIQTVALNENLHKGADFEKLKKQYSESDIFFYDAENTGFGDCELAEKTKTGAGRALRKEAKPCRAPWSEVSILWNGDVVLCCYDYDGFNVVGNIKENTLQDIWQNQKIETIRQLFIDYRSDQLMLCSGCFLAPHNFTTHNLNRNKFFKDKVWNEEKVLLNLLKKKDYQK